MKLISAGPCGGRERQVRAVVNGAVGGVGANLNVIRS